MTYHPTIEKYRARRLRFHLAPIRTTVRLALVGIEQEASRIHKRKETREPEVARLSA